MALDPVANFVRGSTDAATDSTQTTISVVDASVFPNPANGEYNLVLWYDNSHPRPDQDPDVEIVRVTARDTTNDDLTVTRGQEGTAGASHPSGSALHLSPTAKMFGDIPDNFVSNTGDTMTGTLTIEDNIPVLNFQDTDNTNPFSFVQFSGTFRLRDLDDDDRISIGNSTSVDVDHKDGNGLNRILTTADEGSGNGLDADTVDGNEASELGGAKSYTLIDSGTGGVTFSNIPTYDEYELRFDGLSHIGNNSTETNIVMEINGVTAESYSYLTIDGGGIFSSISDSIPIALDVREGQTVEGSIMMKNVSTGVLMSNLSLAQTDTNSGLMFRGELNEPQSLNVLSINSRFEQNTLEGTVELYGVLYN